MGLLREIPEESRLGGGNGLTTGRTTFSPHIPGRRRPIPWKLTSKEACGGAAECNSKTTSPRFQLKAECPVPRNLRKVGCGSLLLRYRRHAKGEGIPHASKVPAQAPLAARLKALALQRNDFCLPPFRRRIPTRIASPCGDPAIRPAQGSSGTYCQKISKREPTDQ